MHTRTCKLTPDAVRNAVHVLLEHGADAFLSGGSWSSDTRLIFGLTRYREYVATDTVDREAIRTFCFSDETPTLGYIAYTAGLQLRGVESTKASRFPQVHLKKYTVVITIDTATGETSIVARKQTDASILHASLLGLGDAPEPTFSVSYVPDAVPSLSKADYCAGVEKTLEAIKDGHTYQLNLSIRFDFDDIRMNMTDYFRYLYRNYPAPFYAKFTSRGFDIVSTSPERFLRVADGEILSQPIKGTLKFDTYTPELEKLLTQSPKEDAELSMIVDLIRNDISINAEPGTVVVPEHKSVFAVDTLLQMYSSVTGKLAEGRDVIDLLLDAFPGGSITGCPKQRSMELIDRFEPHSRDIYCGSFVVIESPVTMDSSIAIRTALYDSKQHRLSFFAGSGIVIDSEPEKEYTETLAKAEKFFATLKPFQ